jgi:3-deoxy-7-phosphoheptulonate synthase
MGKGPSYVNEISVGSRAAIRYAFQLVRMQPIQNVHVRECARLISPRQLKQEFPVSAESVKTVVEGRETVKAILQRKDKRPLIVVGPCSIHDPAGALEYAVRLNKVRDKVKDQMEIVMRVYFEKPRTTIGWKGLINDPNMDGTTDIERGLRIACKLLGEITTMGLPTATEFLDPIIPQYTAELVTWAAIGARTTESQTHREMASGLSMPVGLKNGTDGSLQVAIDAMGAAMHPHSFVGIDQDGMTSVIRTTGNPWGHIVLRGGNKLTNYDPESIAQASQRLEQAGLNPVLMVDCSHANSGKKPEKQEDVWKSVIAQRIEGNDAIIGLMLESYLHQGTQAIPANKSELKYGVSVTDSCLDWDSTERLLLTAHEQLAKGRLVAA